MQYEHNELMSAVKEYIELMKESGLGYIKVKNDKFEIELGEKPAPMPPMPPMMPQLPQMPAMMPAMGAAAPVPAAANAPAQAPKPPVSGKVVKSPIVGTFYASPAPDKPPYVTVGKEVHKGDVLFIIESMKLMNEVTSEFDGKIAEIYLNDAETVEFDQPIMRIE